MSGGSSLAMPSGAEPGKPAGAAGTAIAPHGAGAGPRPSVAQRVFRRVPAARFGVVLARARGASPFPDAFSRARSSLAGS